MRKVSKPNLYMIFIISGLLKCAIAHNAMTNSFTATWMLSSISLLALLYLPLLLSKKNNFSVGLGINLFISLVLLADSIYFRNFNTPLPIDALKLANQLGAVKTDIIDTLFWRDLLLLADIPLILFLGKTITQKAYKLPFNKFLAANCLAVLTFVTLGTSLDTMRYNQTMAVSSFGALSYHVSDILMNANKNGNYRAEFADIYLEKQELYDNKSRNYYGTAAGRNLILIQLESMNNFVINRTIDDTEITPFLNQLIRNDSFYFDRYYQTSGTGRTADAEFSTLNSSYVKAGQIAHQEHTDKTLYALPQALTDVGYEAWAFHGYEPSFWNRENIYPTLGFSRFYSQDDFVLDEMIGWGLGDRSFYRQSAEILEEADTPFFAFLISLTCHYPFFIPQIFKTSSFSTEEHDDSEIRAERIFAHYFHAAQYADYAVMEFFEYLKEKNLYDNSIIVLYGDHYGINKQNEQYEQLMTDYLGREYGYEDMLNIPLIIHIPGIDESETINTVGGQVDLMPTLLNLLGVEKHPDVIHFGQDLLNTQSGFVALPAYVPQGSFVAGNIYFEMARDGMFQKGRAKNLDDGTSIPLTQCRDNYHKALLEVHYANWIMDTDNVFRPYLE